MGSSHAAVLLASDRPGRSIAGSQPRTERERRLSIRKCTPAHRPPRRTTRSMPYNVQRAQPTPRTPTAKDGVPSCYCRSRGSGLYVATPARCGPTSLTPPATRSSQHETVVTTTTSRHSTDLLGRCYRPGPQQTPHHSKLAVRQPRFGGGRQTSPPGPQTAGAPLPVVPL